MFPYSTILKEIPIFTFSFSSTSTKIKVRITIKMNLSINLDVFSGRVDFQMDRDPAQLHGRSRSATEERALER